MELKEIEGATVKLSAGTITVKDENGKTRGMVRGLRRFNTWSSRERFEAWKAITTSGIWGCGIDGLTNCLFLDGKEIIYLNDLKPIEAMKNLSSNPGFAAAFPGEVERCNKRMEIARNASKYMTVIDCYVLI